MKAEKTKGKTPKKETKETPNKTHNKAYDVFLSNIGTGKILDMKAVLK